MVLKCFWREHTSSVLKHFSEIFSCINHQSVKPNIKTWIHSCIASKCLSYEGQEWFLFLKAVMSCRGLSNAVLFSFSCYIFQHIFSVLCILKMTIKLKMSFFFIMSCIELLLEWSISFFSPFLFAVSFAWFYFFILLFCSSCDSTTFIHGPVSYLTPPYLHPIISFSISCLKLRRWFGRQISKSLSTPKNLRQQLPQSGSDGETGNKEECKQTTERKTEIERGNRTFVFVSHDKCPKRWWRVLWCVLSSFSTSITSIHCLLVASSSLAPMFVWLFSFHSFLPSVNLHQTETWGSGGLGEQEISLGFFHQQAERGVLYWNWASPFRFLKLTLNRVGLKC